MSSLRSRSFVALASLAGPARRAARLEEKPRRAAKLRAISDQRSAISDQRSAISDQRSAISDQRQTPIKKGIFAFY
jgi:hypothetical protein